MCLLLTEYRKKDILLHNLCFFWIKKLFAQAEDPYSSMMAGYLSHLIQTVKDRVSLTPNVDDRFHLDALVSVLDKAREHIPHFVPSLTNKQKENIIQSLIDNYDVIHLEHEHRVSMMTALRKDAALTVEAVTRFYKETSRNQGGHKKSPLTGLKSVEKVTEIVVDPNHPEQPPNVRVPETAQPFLARLYHDNIPYASLHSVKSSHAVVLYKNELYHYNCTNLAHPVLALIDIPRDNINRQTAYNALKAKLTCLPKDRIYRAEQEREWMSVLLLEVSKDKYWRPVNLHLTLEFLATFVPFLEKKVTGWHNLKKSTLWLAIMSALLLVMLAVMLYGLGLFPIANMVVLVQFALFPVLAVGLLGFGLAAYSYLQEKKYQGMVNDFTQIDFAKTYPPFNLQPEQSFSVKKRLPTFFNDHQVILATAIPLPAPFR